MCLLSFLLKRRTLLAALRFKKMSEYDQLTERVCAGEYGMVQVEQREEACRRKEEELKQKQNNAKKREERFNAFVQENEKRMAQAEKREKEDRQEAINKAAEIEKRKAELHELEQLRDSRRKQVERMSQYAAFLDEVVEASDTFSDVSELLQRYETLMKSNEDLHQRNASTSNELERTRSQFEQYTKEVQNDVLVKTSQIADMQKRLEKIRSDCMEYEERRRETKDIMNEHTRRYGLARMAIENLYTRARETSFLVKGSKKHGTLMEMLEYIEARILDLQYISNNLSYLQNIQSQSAAPTSTTIRRNTGQQQQEAARLRHLTGQHAVSSRA